jgi:hypothetical protein
MKKKMKNNENSTTSTTTNHHSSQPITDEARQKCPFLKNKDSLSKQEESLNTTTTTTSNNNENSNTTLNTNKNEEKKSNCPIPFHRELSFLMSKQFLIYFIVLIICIILARIL